MESTSVGNLVKECSLLSLDVEDNGGLDFDIEIENAAGVKHKFTLVGTLITEKPVKFNVLRDTMARVWHPRKGVNITELSYNLFLFKFLHEIDINHVLDDGPWAFEQSLLVLRRLRDNEDPFQADLSKSEFWLQVHNLPHGFMSEFIAKAIGNYVGEFVKADQSNFEGGRKEFMRVRIRIDITKPLHRRMKLKSKGGDWFWVDFKYERLPNFCFFCGILGHSDKLCPKLFEGMSMDLGKPFGAWLRATGRRALNPQENQWLISDEQYAEETRNGISGMGQSEEGGLHGAAQSGMDSGKHKESKEYAEWEGMHGDIQEKVNKDLGKGKGVMGSSEYSTAADQIEDMQEDGLVIVDQKRKRADNPHACVEDVQMEPKNLELAGPVNQARPTQ